MCFQGGASGKESICQCRRCGFDPWIMKIPWRGKWQSNTVLLPGKFHGQRSLVGQPMGWQRVRHDLAHTDKKNGVIYFIQDALQTGDSVH